MQQEMTSIKDTITKELFIREAIVVQKRRMKQDYASEKGTFQKAFTQGRRIFLYHLYKTLQCKLFINQIFIYKKEIGKGDINYGCNS